MIKTARLRGRFVGTTLAVAAAVVIVFAGGMWANNCFAAETPENEGIDLPEEVTSIAEKDLESGAESLKVDQKDSESASKAPTEAGNVTLDFKDADIANVLRIISLKSGVNIVAGEDVKGPVTIRLANVPWEKALEVVLKTYGYAYERHGNIIRVTTMDNLALEALETEVFTLTYAKAEEVQQTLQEMLTDRGSVRADARTNVLIVTDVPTNVFKIGKVLERLDKGTPQVLIEAKIVEMTVGEAETLGVRWNMSALVTGPMRPTTFPWDYTRAEENFFRYFPRGKPASSTRNILADGTLGDIVETTEDFPTILRTNRSTPAPTFPYAEPGDFTWGTIDLTNFQILMEAIGESANHKVLSEPRILVLSNQEASILVGEELYIPEYERNSDTGTMEVTGYEIRNIGIELLVTPQINQKDQVSLTMVPSISSLIGFEELTPEVRVPRIAIRNAKTKVRINSGETIVLGGLIEEDVIDDKSKVPILGDLPILDKFFSYTEKTVVKTDVTFFISVTVLNEPGITFDDITGKS